MWRFVRKVAVYATVALVGLALSSLLSSCEKAEDRMGKVTIGTSIIVSGEDGVVTRSSTAVKEGVGKITGGGSYHHGELVKIQANVLPNSNYKLVSLYEKDGKGGYTKEKGMVNETILGNGIQKVANTLCAISFVVSENMSFVALFADGSGDNVNIGIEIGDVKVVDKTYAPDTISATTIELSAL